MVKTPVPPDLVKVELLTMHPFAFEMEFKKIFPFAEEVRFAFSVITPPNILMGPATVIWFVSKVMSAVFPDFPIVKPDMIWLF